MLSGKSNLNTTQANMTPWPRVVVSVVTAVIFLSACDAPPPPAEGAVPDAVASIDEERARRGDAYVVDLSFEDATRQLDDACNVGDTNYLRDQWQRVRPGDNLGTSVRDGNRLVITAALARCVQKWVPDQETDALEWLLDLSRSNIPAHREAAAFAMRESMGRQAVAALFSAAIDADQRVSRFALESLRWKLESAGMSDARDGAATDAELIARNVGKLCADSRLPRQNVDACAAVTLPRP